MIRNLKISTALLLFAIFVFRMLFLNIGLFSSLQSQKDSTSKKTYFSNTMKKRMTFGAQNDSKNAGYSEIEICDEDGDDDHLFKITPFIILQSFYSLGANNTKNKLTPFHRSFSFSASPRYLTFRVFRI